MKTPAPSSSRDCLFAWLVFAVLVTPLTGIAQSTTAAPSAEKAKTEEPPIELAPFEVRTDKDTGYSAQNTTSGSRLNTSLADTPAAISVFTKEFIDDIGATSVDDLIEYSINSRSNLLEGANLSAASPEGSGGALTNNDPILDVRGVAGASRLTNFFQSAVTQDTFNMERAELTRGPNSVLFGVGQPAGGFNVTTKKGDVTREAYAASFRFGSWNEARTTLDVNQPVIRQKLGVRINAVNEDRNGWRPFTYDQEQRYQFNVRWQIARNTRLDVEYELGRREYANAPQTGMIDQITPWIAAGRQLDTVVGQPTGAAGTAATAALTAGGMQLLTNVNSLVYDTTSGVLYNVRNQSVSAPPGGGVNTARESVHIFDFNLVPREAFIGGPGYGTSNDYDRFNTTFSHELLKDLFVEASYNREVVDNLARNTIEGVGNRIQVDTNAFLPSGAANPHAGEFYAENYVVLRGRETRNDDYRVSASYDFEPSRRLSFVSGWLGRQRFAGMFHSRRAGSIENQQEEVLIQNPYATTSPDEGNGNLNRLRRRTYLGTSIKTTDGLQDYRSFPVNGLTNQYTGLATTSLPVTTMFVPFGQTRDTFRRTNASLLVWQGHLLQDRLVATVGYREDRLMTILPDTTVRAAAFAPFTQGILLPARSSDRMNTRGITRNQGLVAKPLSWLSLFYNRSSSFDTPAATVRIFNDAPAPSSQGLTEDYGAKFALLRGKLFATVTRYETSANNQAGNGGVITYLNELNSIWNTLRTAGVPEAAAATVFANGRTFDRKSTGWELELTANLTSSWRLILNYSANKTIQSGEGKEIMDYVTQMTPLFTASGRGNLVLVGGAGGVTIAQQLQAMQSEFEDQFISPNGGRQSGQPVAQGNMRTTYSFRENALRGLSVGGGVRWRGERVIGFTSTDPQTRRELRGDPTTTTDANISYRRKVGLFGRKYDLTFQVNVNNLLDDDDLIITRAFIDGTPRTFSMPAPRQWFMTTTVRF